MAALIELHDDFADGTLNTTLWSGSYGDPTESGGQAHIPCSTGYAGLKSAASYTLAGSSVAVRLAAADPTGAASAAASVLVLSSTGGTDAGFIVDSAQNALGLWLREGYADVGALFPTYDPTAHAWLRLRETAGSVLWEASPDGRTWTTLRTATSPAWTADGDLAFLIEGHRDAGPTSSIDIASVNVPPALNLTPAQASAAAQPLALTKHLPLAPITVQAAPLAPQPSKARSLVAAQAYGGPGTLTTAKHLALTTGQAANTLLPAVGSKRLALTAAQQTATAHVLASPQADEADFTVGQPYTSWEVGQPW
jgi:hypothetical protein